MKILHKLVGERPEGGIPYVIRGSMNHGENCDTLRLGGLEEKFVAVFYARTSLLLDLSLSDNDTDRE